jgi:hypothetical protein
MLEKYVEHISKKNKLRIGSNIWMFFFQSWHLRSWRERRKKTGQPWLRIDREQRNMKRFVAIEFEQKWIMPFCSPTHLASDWYWTLITLMNLRLSNRLVNINHIYLPRRNSSSVFCSHQDLKCQVWKKQSYFETYFSISNLPKWSRASTKGTYDSLGGKKGSSL